MSILTIYGHLLSIFILFFLLKTEVSELKITAILKPNDVLPQYNSTIICYQSVIIRLWYKVRPKARRLNRTLEVIWFSFVTVS